MKVFKIGCWCQVPFHCPCLNCVNSSETHVCYPGLCGLPPLPLSACGQPYLYLVADVSRALNTVVGTNENNTITHSQHKHIIDHAHLCSCCQRRICTGSNSHSNYSRNKIVLHIRKVDKSGRNEESKRFLLIGWFSLLKTVPFCDQLVWFLEEDWKPKASNKKQTVATYGFFQQQEWWDMVVSWAVDCTSVATAAYVTRLLPTRLRHVLNNQDLSHCPPLHHGWVDREDENLLDTQIFAMKPKEDLNHLAELEEQMKIC